MIRLDLYLVREGLAESRTQAQELITSGRIQVERKVCLKPSFKVSTKNEVISSGALHPYVSRGGLKLEGALEEFSVDVHGCVALDVGAGTGGFTDCLLQNGAKQIYCVDVGSGQLHERLRNDPRVTFRENCHIKDFSPAEISDKIDIIVIDLSFISLMKIIKYIKGFAVDGTQLIALFKPQFEVGKEYVGKHGIVKRGAPIEKHLNEVSKRMREYGFCVKGSALAKISGGDGNQEFLLYAQHE